ncbi:FRG domain-containing protein [Carnobacterium maltaromaticum]|uniref:FRG domain-containing protein n=1 Tax=Carnobacterium maltaromaticum TaxID=2751 RepID=UPI00107288B6|nr:FRG domain-containing protein [Carnobacterium maltaromaticum]TFJ72014.1 hypothetical protein CKN94_12520 [Carnobacterium maltaromaticum]TFJ76927.1 hypothetical protein CKN97_12510 [Carnobacterium maltaromaticum]
MGSTIILKYMTEIMDKVNTLLENTGLNKDNSIVAYRGESEDFGESKLKPSFFRGEQMNEMRLFETLKDYNITENEADGYIKRAVDSQHYIAKSRLLDITFNILSSLYFACDSDFSKKKDGIVYIFNFPSEIYFSINSEYIEKYYGSYLNKKNEKFIINRNFKVLGHAMQNKRIVAQQGGFIFFQGEASHFSPIPDEYYTCVTIDTDDKEELIKELEYYFGLERSIIYPEKEYKSAVISKKLTQGIKEASFDNYLNVEINQFFTILRNVLSVQKYDKEKNLTYSRRYFRKEKTDFMKNLIQWSKSEYCKEEEIKEIVSGCKENFDYLEWEFDIK